MPQTDESIWYQLYFQTPGVAERELEKNVRESIRRIVYSFSGDAPPGPVTIADPATVGMLPRRGGLLTRSIDPPVLPQWFSEDDLDFYASEFSRTGFRGGLNYYRNADRNWELLARTRTPGFRCQHSTSPVTAISCSTSAAVERRDLRSFGASFSNYGP
jgi:hypothetical protein